VFGKGAQKVNEEIGCAEILYDASRWFSAGRDAARAAEVKTMLLDPKNGLHRTDFAKRLQKP
jgi:hypothetical protein